MTVPISVQIESLFHQWISSLRDYSRSHGEWRQNIKDDLWDIYIQILELGRACEDAGDAADMTTNAYYLLITSRDFDQHLKLSTRNNNVYIS